MEGSGLNKRFNS